MAMRLLVVVLLTAIYTLTGLHNGETYNISIAALSIDLPSSAVSVEFEITLSE